VLARFDPLRRNLEARRQYGKLNLDFTEFLCADRFKPGILERSGLCAMGDDFGKRLSGVDLADASAEFAALAQSNESAHGFHQRRILRERDRRLAAFRGLGQGAPGQFQKQLLLAITETGHPEVFLSLRRPSRCGDAFPEPGN
jgi:hypothetical protein